MILEAIGSVMSQIPVEVYVHLLILAFVSTIYVPIHMIYTIVIGQTKSYYGFLSVSIIGYAGAVCAIIFSCLEFLGHKILPGLITPPDIFIFSMLIGLIIYLSVIAWNKYYWGTVYPPYNQTNHRTWSNKK